MLPTTTRTFRIRNYECDAYGHLNNANYLRFMQETAFDASSAVGYDLARYEKLGHNWVIRETGIEYFTPLSYDETVEIRTWVADFRRASSRRMYEFRRVGSNNLVARAYSDWVYIQRATGLPAPIPDEMKRAVLPDYDSEHFPERPIFPNPPPAPKGAFTLTRRVEWQELDSLARVNNAIYLDYASECGFHAVASYQWPWVRMKAEGFGILLRSNQIQYQAPAVLEDELEITTWLSDVRAVQATRHYSIKRSRDGAPIAMIHALGVCVELASGRPMRWPKAMLEDFAPGIAV